MQEMLANDGVRVAIIAIVASLLVQGVKRWKSQLAGSKVAVRLVTLAAVAIGALAADWGPDGQITVATWWPVFWQSALGAEFSYQWLLKYVSGMGSTDKLATSGVDVGAAEDGC